MSETTFTIKLMDGDDGWVVAECVELPGCYSQGKTQLSALANINDAIRAVLKVKSQAVPTPPAAPKETK